MYDMLIHNLKGTSPSQIWSGPGTMRGITSPTQTDAVGQCALTTLRYDILSDSILVHLSEIKLNMCFSSLCCIITLRYLYVCTYCETKC